MANLNLKISDETHKRLAVFLALNRGEFPSQSVAVEVALKLLFDSRSVLVEPVDVERQQGA